MIIDKLIKIIYYKLAKIIIDASGLAKVIIDEIICHYKLLDLIISNYGLVFILRIYFSFCYFLKIKRKLTTPFYSQIDGHKKEWKSTI